MLTLEGVQIEIDAPSISELSQYFLAFFLLESFCIQGLDEVFTSHQFLWQQELDELFPKLSH